MTIKRETNKRAACVPPQANRRLTEDYKIWLMLIARFTICVDEQQSELKIELSPSAIPPLHSWTPSVKVAATWPKFLQRYMLQWTRVSTRHVPGKKR